MESDCDCRKYIDCNGHAVCRVDLGYVADCPTCLLYTDSYGSREFDLLPLIQAGETDTSLELLEDIRRIRYYPEIYTRTHGKQGHYCDVCITDLEALMHLTEIGDVQHDTPSTGDVLVFNAETNTWEFFDLEGTLGDINNHFTNVEQHLDNLDQSVRALVQHDNEIDFNIRQLFEITTRLESRLNDLEKRLKSIEDAIYDWPNDKSTKIPRGTINVTSGGYNSQWGIFSRPKNQNDDLNFE